MARRILAAGTVLLAVGAALAADVAFTKKPTLSRTGDSATVSFTISSPTDVEVAVLDARGRIVRHLAAGLVKKGALGQRIVWDGTDDLGSPAKGGPFQVRVRVGSKPTLERHVGRDPQTVGGGILAITVGQGGELFVMDSPGWGRTNVRVFNRKGEYVRTILPYPADTPKERTASVGHLIIDGTRIPMVFNGQGGNVMPLTHGMRNQTMAVHPKGHLLLVSALGTMAEHGPPRHLLTLHPKGGAPRETGFVGPEVRAPKGFLGGAGEGGVRRFDHLAVSPDGKSIYFCPTRLGGKNARHAVFRLKWSDKKLGEPFLGENGKPGDDNAHFNDPQGLAVDPKGRLYVCDRANNRVTRFSSEGTFLGSFAVDSPQQIAVHPKTGAIYVLSRRPSAKRRNRWDERAVLRRFTGWEKGAPKETATVADKPFELIALDPEAEPTQVWAVLSAGWSRQALVPVIDKGGTLEMGTAVNNYKGLRFPMFLAADPQRNRVIVREMFLGKKGFMSLDLSSGAIERLRGPGGKGLVGADVALDRDGNIYLMDGYGTNSMSRYSPDGRPLPFSGIGSHTIKTGTYRGYGPDMGMRGHCVGLNGDMYLMRSSNYGDSDVFGNRVDVFGPDGRPKKRNLVDGLGYGDCGLGVDAAGNVYVGANVRPKDKPYPDGFNEQVSAEPFAWWRRGTRKPPWHYMYLNPYLFHWGSVLKFGPEGGALYGHIFYRKPVKPVRDVFFADRAPKGAIALRSAYLQREIKVVGMQWRFAGMAPVPSSSDGPRPDPGCVCMPSHLAVDPFGRVFVPDGFRFSVPMLDSKGNLLHRIGGYGNVDTRGPEIGFVWPAFLAVADGTLYAADTVNARIAVIRFDWADEAVVPLR